MKKIFIALCFMCFGMLSMAQTVNNISVYYGTADGIKTPLLIGDWQNPGQSFSFELNYTRVVYKILSVETGLRYSESIVTTGFDAEPWRPEVKGHLYLISVPLNMKITLGKYFFTYAGLTFDRDFNRDALYPMEDQSGVGIDLGLGAKVDIGKFRVSLSPFYRKHAILASHQSGEVTHLHDLGIKFGVGFNF